MHRPHSSSHIVRQTTLALSMAFLLAASPTVRADPPSAARVPDVPRASQSPRLAVPVPDAEGAGRTPIGRLANGTVVAPNAQSLSAPVTVNAATSADALTATQSGSGRAISGVINNASNSSNALRGASNGSGAALAGQNTGTTGSAGQFQVTNAGSSQAVLVSSVVGNGNAVRAIQGNTGSSDTPAVLGQNQSRESYGVGVEGDGYVVGVRGVGMGRGTGVNGVSNSGAGVVGVSKTGIAIAGSSGSGSGSYAGYFDGPVYVTDELDAMHFVASSDRHGKEAFAAVDGASILERIAAMPISSWDFQTTPGIHHIGPMAQDFRAAFGLGADEKHIDVVDGVGVSLAAIQELQRQVKDKTALAIEQRARIDALEARLGAMEQRPDSVATVAVQR